MNNNNLLLMGVSGAILIYFIMDRTEQTARKVRKAKKHLVYMSPEDILHQQIQQAEKHLVYMSPEDIRYQQKIQEEMKNDRKITGAIQKPTIIELGKTEKPTLFDPFKFQTAQEYKDEIKKAEESYQKHKDGKYENEPVYPDIEVICTNKRFCDITGKMKK